MDVLDGIRSDLAALRADNEQLRLDNIELRARLDRIDEQPAPVDEFDAPVSRRGLLAKAAVIAAGAAAGVAMLERPAAAYTATPLNIGEHSHGDYQTLLDYGVIGSVGTPAAPTSLANVDAMLVVDNSGSPRPTSIGVTAVGRANGIYAHSSDARSIAVQGIGAGAGSIGGHFYGPNLGVQAISPFVAVFASGGATGYGINLQGRRPLVLQTGHGAAGAPVDQSFQGEIAFDTQGSVFLCVADGTPGVYRKLAGFDTAGALHLLPRPRRVFDSRAAQLPQGTDSGGPKGALVSGSAVTIDCKANASGVPADALGISFNLTITATVLSGYLTTWGAGAKPLTSSINWTVPNLDTANGVTIACGPNAVIQVAAGGAGSTDFIIDVTGYYR